MELYQALITPVSYTHLDVYKRQPQEEPGVHQDPRRQPHPLCAGLHGDRLHSGRRLRHRGHGGELCAVPRRHGCLLYTSALDLLRGRFHRLLLPVQIHKAHL